MNDEKKKLLEIFEELFGIEKTARDYYQMLLDQKQLDNNSTKIIQSIHDDEVKHMSIAKKIIDIIEADKP